MLELTFLRFDNNLVLHTHLLDTHLLLMDARQVAHTLHLQHYLLLAGVTLSEATNVELLLVLRLRYDGLGRLSWSA